MRVMIVRRRKNGMVGTYTTTTSSENTNREKIQIEQYPEKNFHFRRSFDDCYCDTIMVEKKDNGYFQDQLINGSISGRERARTFAYEGEFISSSSPVGESFPTCFPNGNGDFPNGDQIFPDGKTIFPTRESRIKDIDKKNITNHSKTLESPTILLNNVDLSTNHTEDRTLNIQNSKQPMVNGMLSSSNSSGSEVKQSNVFTLNNALYHHQQMESDDKHRINLDSVIELKIQQNDEQLMDQKHNNSIKKTYQEECQNITNTDNFNQQHLQNSRLHQLRNTDNAKTRNRTRSSEGLEIGNNNKDNSSNKRSSFFMKLRKTFSFDNIDLTSVFGNNKPCDHPTLHVVQGEDNQQLSIHQNHLSTKRRRSFSTNDIEKIEGGRVCSPHKLPFSYEVW